MSLVKSATEKASARVAKCEQDVAKWEAESAAKRAELADLERRVGDEVLADEAAADRLPGELAALRARIDVADRTVVSAGRELDAARRDLRRTFAGEVRDRAKKLLGIADDRVKKTARLLAEVRAHEGADYVPWRPGPMNPGDLVVVHTPFTQVLRDEAAALRAWADNVERIADTGTPDQVSAPIAAAPVGPAEAAVLDNPSVSGDRLASMTAQQVRGLGVGIGV